MARHTKQIFLQILWKKLFTDTKSWKSLQNCKLCYKIFVKLQSLRNHFKTFHEGDKFECNWCKKSFVSAGNLKIHQKSMHDNIKFNCDSCHRSFATSQNLKAHKESVHENIKYNCNSCGKSMQYKRPAKTLCWHRPGHL